MKGTLATLAARWGAWSAISSNRKIFSASLQVGSIAGCVSLVGLGREAAVARMLGLGDEVDAFVLALALATFPVSMVAGSFHSAVVPAVLNARQTEGMPAARHVAGAALGRTMLSLCATIAIFAVLVPILLPLLSTGFSAEKRALTHTLFLVLLPGLFFAGVATVLSGILQAAERFASAALSPVSVHGFVLLCLVAWGAQLGGAHALAIGTVLGHGAQVVWLGMLVYARGLSARPALRGPYVRAREAATLSLWVGLHAVAHAFVLAMAASLGPGAIAAYNYAMRLPGVLAGMVAGPLTQASLPYLSRHAIDKDWTGLQHVLGSWTRMILLAGLPAALAMALYSEAIVGWIFQGGAFSAEDARLVAWIQAALFLQAPFFVLTQFQSRAVIAMKRHGRLVFAGAFLLVLTLLFGATLPQLFGAPGLGLAVALAFASVAAWYGFSIRRSIRAQVAASKAS